MTNLARNFDSECPGQEHYGAPVPVQPGPGQPASVARRPDLTQDWQALRDVGLKGFYLDGSGVVPDEATLAEDPDAVAQGLDLGEDV